MSEPTILQADHLQPGDVIMHNRRPYRVTQVRHVSPDADRRADGHIEIEASPVGHECAGLVTRFATERAVSLADLDDIPRCKMARTAVQTALSLLLATTVLVAAHRQPQTACGRDRSVQRTSLMAPCHLDLAQPYQWAPRERRT